jgi:hypothetical protein
VVGIVFIASNHFLAVAPILSTADGPRPWSGRSASPHQRLKSQWSVVMTISTAIVHLIRRHMSDKAVADGPTVHREDAKNVFYRTRHLRGFSGFPTTEWSELEAGQSAVGLGRCSLLLRTVHSVNSVFAVFLSESHPGVMDGPGIGVFQKVSPVRNNLRYSGQST